METEHVSDKRFEIFTYIKNYIKKNNLAEGEMIPSQNKLAEQFKVNRNVVRGALAQLSAQGLIYSRKGKGFFVSGKNKPILFEHENGMGFSEILNNGKREYESTIMKYSKAAAGITLGKIFEISPDSLLHQLKVLRSIDGIPFAICQSYLPDRLVPDFDMYLEHFQSVNTILIKHYNYHHPVCRQVTIDACMPTSEDIKLLDIPIQMPILRQNEIFVIDDIGVIEYFSVRARGDRFKFKMSFTDSLR